MRTTDSDQPIPVRLYHRTSPKRSEPLAMYELVDTRVSIREALYTLDILLPAKWQNPMAVIQGGKSPLMLALQTEGGANAS